MKLLHSLALFFVLTSPIIVKAQWQPAPLPWERTGPPNFGFVAPNTVPQYDGLAEKYRQIHEQYLVERQARAIESLNQVPWWLDGPAKPARQQYPQVTIPAYQPAPLPPLAPFNFKY